MKIGIISDTHGCVSRWSLAYEKFLKDADFIVHAGDVLYHGPRNPILADYNPAALAEVLNACPVPLIVAKGNCDSEVDAMVLDLPIQAPYGYVMAGNFKVVVTHGDLLSEEEKQTQARKLKADLYITGHTHDAQLYRSEKTIFLNPGSPSMSKREDHRATIAIVDDEKAEIIDLDTAEVIATLFR